MVAGSHLSLHIPLFSRGGRRSPAHGSDNEKSKRHGLFVSDDVDAVVSPLKARPVSLPLMSADGTPQIKLSSMTQGTLKHNPHDVLSQYRSSPLARGESIERPVGPSPRSSGRRRSQTSPPALLRRLQEQKGINPADVERTPRSAGQYNLFPVAQSPDTTVAGSPTPTGPRFNPETAFPMPPQMPVTDRQRRALPKPPTEQLEHMKQDNAQLKELLDTTMNHLTAEELRSEQLESRSRRLEESLQALTAQQHNMMVELSALRAQLALRNSASSAATAVTAIMTPPRKSSKRPKTRDAVLDNSRLQLEIALRAPKLLSSSDEHWVHPTLRSSSSERTSEDSGPTVPDMVDRTTSDASSDISFRDITASEYERYCGGGGSPTSGPEFWDPAYYEGNAPLATPSQLSDIDPLTIVTSSTSTSDAVLSDLATKTRTLQLSPIPSTPDASIPRIPLRVDTNLTARQRGLRAAIVPAPPHRPSNVHNIQLVDLRSGSASGNTRMRNSISTSSPVARPSGPRPSYAARKMSMQGHLTQPLQPSPLNSGAGEQAAASGAANMASTYRPDRRPSSIVRALANQGFGMGANGLPLGMTRSDSQSQSSSSGSVGGGSVGGESSADDADRIAFRRGSSAWSSACSPRTVKIGYRWTGAEVA